MSFIIVALLIMIFSKASYAKADAFNSDYLSLESTTAINGVFVILVFLRHFGQYCDLESAADAAFVKMDLYLGQLIVVPFLFFSGYGIMLSIMKKGTPYVKRIFKDRFLKILLHFDICVFFYMIIALAFKADCDWKEYLLAFTSWTSIGNSNWYITATLALYIITTVSFLIIRKKHFIAMILFTGLTGVFIFFNIKVGRPSYTYNTVMVFPLGMFYAYFKPNIDKLVMKNNIVYTLALSAVSLCYLFSGMHSQERAVWYSLWSASFILLIVIISMKIKINNPMLMFFGKHVFSIYILQRIPMRLLYQFDFNSSPINMFIVSFAVTLFIALAFDAAMKKLDSRLFDRKKLK